MKSMRMRSGLAEPLVPVPPDIYIPLVDSLYKDGRTLFILTHHALYASELTAPAGAASR